MSPTLDVRRMRGSNSRRCTSSVMPTKQAIAGDPADSHRQ